MIILSWKKNVFSKYFDKEHKNLNECFSLPVYQIKQVFLNGICFMEERKLDRGWIKAMD